MTASPFRPAFLLYHFQFNLSSTFFKFFQIFFQVTRHTSYRATFILYHLSVVLSSTFSKKSKTSANLTFRSPKTFSIFSFVPVLSSDSFYIISRFFGIVNSKFVISLSGFLVTFTNCTSYRPENSHKFPPEYKKPQRNPCGS